MASGVKVRGSCTAGHITEATAPPRRVTWNGTCSHDGCGLPVTARRIPRDRVPDAPPAGDNTSDQYPFVKVDDYGQLPEHGPDDGLTVEPPTAKPAGHLPAPGAGESAGASDGGPAGDPAGRQEQPPDPISDEPRRNRIRDRLRARSAREWEHPLIG